MLNNARETARTLTEHTVPGKGMLAVDVNSIGHGQPQRHECRHGQSSLDTEFPGCTRLADVCTGSMEGAKNQVLAPRCRVTASTRTAWPERAQHSSTGTPAVAA